MQPGLPVCREALGCSAVALPRPCVPEPPGVTDTVMGGGSPASGAALLLGVRTETLCVTSEVTPVMNSSDSISGGKHFLHFRLMCFPFVVRNENLCSRWCPLPPELQMVLSQRDADHSCWAPRLLVGSCPPWERILHLFLWSCSCWFAFTLGNAVVLKKNPKF